MSEVCGHLKEIEKVAPSGPGCVECMAHDGWWVHLRRCATCGHIGCCDSSPNRHARKHAQHEKHHIIQSYEPGEDWLYCFADDLTFDIPCHGRLAQPSSGMEPRPSRQSAGGIERIPGVQTRSAGTPRVMRFDACRILATQDRVQLAQTSPACGREDPSPALQRWVGAQNMIRVPAGTARLNAQCTKL